MASVEQFGPALAFRCIAPDEVAQLANLALLGARQDPTRVARTHDAVRDVLAVLREHHIVLLLHACVGVECDPAWATFYNDLLAAF